MAVATASDSRWRFISMAENLSGDCARAFSLSGAFSAVFLKGEEDVEAAGAEEEGGVGAAGKAGAFPLSPRGYARGSISQSESESIRKGRRSIGMIGVCMRGTKRGGGKRDAARRVGEKRFHPRRNRTRETAAGDRVNYRKRFSTAAKRLAVLFLMNSGFLVCELWVCRAGVCNLLKRCKPEVQRRILQNGYIM